MQLPWDEHFFEIVIPAWQAYLAAEKQISLELAAGSNIAQRARYAALREGGAASFYVHHFGEIALRARPRWLPDRISKPNQVVDWLSDYCTALRTENPIDDVSLLRDVADALKHAILSRNLQDRQVSANEAVLVLPTTWDEMTWDDFQWDAEQVSIRTTNGRLRPLAGVLQNVIDAWRRVASIDLPPIGEP
jgi:hypothetical protein